MFIRLGLHDVGPTWVCVCGGGGGVYGGDGVCAFQCTVHIYFRVLLIF